ncbi:hypothetical protein LPB67_16910, partial [Undibacterium sp. Jales W-56]|uniref:hypothetical protein n=1 Tax=Undibacterium sp. Jales W-56 TaxID=2897325 RepID=UPI0021CF58AC
PTSWGLLLLQNGNLRTSILSIQNVKKGAAAPSFFAFFSFFSLFDSRSLTDRAKTHTPPSRPRNSRQDSDASHRR